MIDVAVAQSRVAPLLSLSLWMCARDVDTSASTDHNQEGEIWHRSRYTGVTCPE